MAATCEECLEPSDDVEERQGVDLCAACAAEWDEFEDYVTDVNATYRASVL